MHWTRWRASRESAWSGSDNGTWCAIHWWRASSVLTTNAKRPVVRRGGRGSVRRRTNDRAMEPPSRRPPPGDADGTAIEIIVAEPAWHRLVPRAEAVVRRAGRAAGMHATVV